MKFLLLGAIQGLTEFLPVSSSGHLYLLKQLLHIEGHLLAFFIFLHLATLLAIGIFLRKQIWAALFNKKLLISIIVITAVTAVIGISIDFFIKRFFENKYFVPLCLLINAGILLSIRNISAKRKCQDITLKDALILGLLQGIAILPGISRSGITICGFLKRGFAPTESFALSFLIAVPIMSGTFILKLRPLLNMQITYGQMTGGFLAAFILGIAALAVVKRSLLKARFNTFGYYCLLLALVSFVFL